MQNKQAFTLIELLVVVLIIGILAAVALPQYQMAVLKSRLSSVIPAVKAVVDAEQIIFLSDGEYEKRDLTRLDIDYPGCTINTVKGMFTCENFIIDVSTFLSDWDVTGFLLEQGKAGQIAYSYDLENHSYLCVASETSTIAQKVCQSMGGTNPIRYSNSGYSDRILQPVLVYTL